MRRDPSIAASIAPKGTASEYERNGHSTMVTTQQQRTHSSWEWLSSLPQPLQLLQTLVMPTIAQNLSGHALLAEINHTLVLLGLD